MSRSRHGAECTIYHERHTQGHSRRGRAVSRAILLVGTPVVLGYGTFAQGGFHWSQALPMSACYSGLLLVTLATTRAGARDALLGVAGAGCLAAGLVTSILVHGWNEAGGLALATFLVAVSSLFVARELVARGLFPHVLVTLVWIGLLVAVTGLIGVAFHFQAWGLKAGGLWRASSTLSYANATGALLVATLPAPLLLETFAPRALNRLAMSLILASLLATVSRGAVGGLLLMLLIVVALGGLRLLQPLLRPATGALLAFAALVPSVLGSHGRPALAGAGIVAGAAIGILPSGATARTRGRQRFVTGALLILASAAVTVAVVGQLGSFHSRFGSDSRLSTWGATIRAASSSSPLTGIGLGRLQVTYEVDHGEVTTRFAHNEFLQVFAETGVVGLISTVAALGLFAAWAWRGRGQTRAGLVWIAASGAGAAFLLQSIVDIMWRFPLLPALAFSWLGIAATRDPSEGGSL